ncbi:MAG: hypothetical protein NTU88_05580 [Armatimonadetes bacterium]|nr:hypothetical protein [Armatimonadota bacterium]
MRSVKITEAEAQAGPRTEIIISPLRVLRVLTWTTAAVLLLNFAVLASRVLTGHGHLLGFGSMFYVGQEANVPTWYSSSLLLLCSALLWIIACATKRVCDGRSRWWTALSVVFLLMSIDETATIHERIGGLCEYVFRTEFFKDFGFVLPGAILVCVTALLFLRFVLRLPPATRKLFILAAVLYAWGASGMEGVSLGWSARNSPALPMYSFLVTIEEIFEMSGLLVFIYALTSYIARHLPGVEIGVRYADRRSTEGETTVRRAKTARTVLE